MNKDQFQGAWKMLSGKVKEKWGKLTDDEITRINGRRETLIGLLQQKYGYAKERAEEELTRFETQLVGSGVGHEPKANPNIRPNTPHHPEGRR